jgi:hypothetical protein
MNSNLDFGNTKRILASVAIGALVVLRYTAFYPLMWLRIIVVPLSQLCALLGFVGLCLAALMIPDAELLWRLGGFSFGAFALGWAYDGMLLLLSPRPLLLDSSHN